MYFDFQEFQDAKLRLGQAVPSSLARRQGMQRRRVNKNKVKPNAGPCRWLKPWQRKRLLRVMYLDCIIRTLERMLQIETDECSKNTSTRQTMTRFHQVFTVSEVAGIMAAKRTPDLLPLFETEFIWHFAYLGVGKSLSPKVPPTAPHTSHRSVGLQALSSTFFHLSKIDKMK